MNSKTELAAELERLIETLRQLSVIVEDFEEERQPIVFEKLNMVTEHYRRLDELKHSCDVVVPANVLEHIDAGRNPDRYTRSVLKDSIKISKRTEARLASLSDFNDCFAAELQSAYPEEMKEYEALCAEQGDEAICAARWARDAGGGRPASGSQEGDEILMDMKTTGSCGVRQ